MIAKILDDRIILSGQRLTICSCERYQDWEVREYRRVFILFDGKEYVLHQVSRNSGNEYLYTLDECSHENEIPGNIIRYDEEYVKRHLIHSRIARAMWFVKMITFVLEPFFGLLWSSLKTQWDRKNLVFDRYASTRKSLWLLCAILILNFFVETDYPYIVIFLILPDLAVRFERELRDTQNDLGFYEWLFLWLFRRELAGRNRSEGVFKTILESVRSKRTP